MCFHEKAKVLIIITKNPKEFTRFFRGARVIYYYNYTTQQCCRKNIKVFYQKIEDISRGRTTKAISFSDNRAYTCLIFNIYTTGVLCRWSVQKLLKQSIILIKVKYMRFGKINPESEYNMALWLRISVVTEELHEIICSWKF